MRRRVSTHSAQLSKKTAPWLAPRRFCYWSRLKLAGLPQRMACIKAQIRSAIAKKVVGAPEVVKPKTPKARTSDAQNIASLDRHALVVVLVDPRVRVKECLG